MNSQNNSGGLQKELIRFSGVVGGIAALFLAPYVAQNFRKPMYEYLFTSFSHDVSYYGSWLFVGLILAAAYFAASMVLHILAHSIISWVANRRYR